MRSEPTTNAEALRLAESIVGEVPESLRGRRKVLLAGKLASRIALLEAAGKRRKLSSVQEEELAKAVASLKGLRHHEDVREAIVEST